MSFFHKGAALELSVQMIGLISDEAEDKLQDCPIYIELVGLRRSKKFLYAGITVGVVVIAGLIGVCIWRKKNSRFVARDRDVNVYNKTATEYV